MADTSGFPPPPRVVVVARLHYLVRKLLRNESNFPRATKLPPESRGKEGLEEKGEKKEERRKTRVVCDDGRILREVRGWMARERIL